LTCGLRCLQRTQHRALLREAMAKLDEVHPTEAMLRPPSLPRRLVRRMICCPLVNHQAMVMATARQQDLHTVLRRFLRWMICLASEHQMQPHRRGPKVPLLLHLKEAISLVLQISMVRPFKLQVQEPLDSRRLPLASLLQTRLQTSRTLARRLHPTLGISSSLLLDIHHSHLKSWDHNPWA